MSFGDDTLDPTKTYDDGVREGRRIAEAELRKSRKCGHPWAYAESVPLTSSAIPRCLMCIKEAELRAPGPCGKHPQACWTTEDEKPDWTGIAYCPCCAEIAALQADLTKAVRLAADYGIERDQLREGLRDELLRLGHAARNSDPSISVLYNRWAERLEPLQAKVSALNSVESMPVNALTGIENALREERDALREALVKLLDKLDAIGEATKGIYTLAHVHGMGYRGPNWSLEYEAARKLLSVEMKK